MDNQTTQYILPYDNAIHQATKDEKKEWFGEGEWENEPDIIHLHYKNFECVVRRIMGREGVNGEHVYGGFLNGYVRIPVDHPYFNKGWNDLTDLNVHGGITFTECEDEAHWIGFDCAHGGDYHPSIEAFKKTNKEMQEFYKNHPFPKGYEQLSLFHPTYKNVNFVMGEIKELVDQLTEIKKVNDGNN